MDKETQRNKKENKQTNAQNKQKNPKKSMGRDEQTNTNKHTQKPPGSGTIEFQS
jgi:hypothetical protein